MFKDNEWVMLLDKTTFGQVQSYTEESVIIKLQSGEVITTDISNIRKRKNCVCNKTMSYPFCDGSHSR